MYHFINSHRYKSRSYQILGKGYIIQIMIVNFLESMSMNNVYGIYMIVNFLESININNVYGISCTTCDFSRAFINSAN